MNTRDPDSTRWPISPEVLAAVTLVLATTAAYSTSFRGPFLFDDNDAIRNNATITHLWPPWGLFSPPGNSTVNFRPVLNASFALNYAVSGLATWSYHALNLAIHLGAGLVLFGLVRRTLARPGPQGRPGPTGVGSTAVGFLTALIWMLHPVTAQGVAYIVQRAESLMGLFYLLTLYLFVRGVDGGARSRSWYAASCAACLLGMGTKETMATAPLIVLLYDRTFVGGTWREALRKRRGYYAGLAATWLAFIPTALSGAKRDPTSGFGVAPYWGYVQTQFHAIAHYLRIALWPRIVQLYYERNGTIDFAHQPGAGTVLLYAAVVVPLVAATAWAVWRNKPIGFLGGWFFGILALTSFIPSASDIMADRRMYLPLAAVVVLVVCAVCRGLHQLAIPALAALAVALGAVTERTNGMFASETALWKAQEKAMPDDPLAHDNLGIVLWDAHRTAEAAKEFGEAVGLDPSYEKAILNLAIALQQEGQLGRSEETYRQGLRAAYSLHAESEWTPKFDRSLATLLINEQRPAEAALCLEDALRFDPGNAQNHFLLGAALGQSGRYAEGIRELEQAVALDPGLERAKAMLAQARALGIR